jgi:hypothetical protein
MITLGVIELTRVEQIREYYIFSSCFNFQLFYLNSGLGKKEISAPLNTMLKKICGTAKFVAIQQQMRQIAVNCGKLRQILANCGNLQRIGNICIAELIFAVIWGRLKISCPLFEPVLIFVDQKWGNVLGLQANLKETSVVR